MKDKRLNKSIKGWLEIQVSAIHALSVYLHRINSILEINEEELDIEKLIYYATRIREKNLEIIQRQKGLKSIFTTEKYAMDEENQELFEQCVQRIESTSVAFKTILTKLIAFARNQKSKLFYTQSFIAQL